MDSGMIFVHISKTGGTSVEAALGIRHDLHTARELISVYGEYAWDEAFTFSFVRHPWDRAYSGLA